jgi:phosphatidate cytidylyltransferase
MNPAEPARPRKGQSGHEASPDHDAEDTPVNGTPSKVESGASVNGVPAATTGKAGTTSAGPTTVGPTTGGPTTVGPTNVEATSAGPATAEPTNATKTESLKAEPAVEPTDVEPLDVESSDAGQPVEPGAAPPERKRNAGRDLRAAIAVGAGMGALALISLLTVRQLFIGVIAAAVAVSTFELAGALRRSKAAIDVALLPVLVGGQAMVWLSWQWREEGILGAFVVTCLACLVWRFRGGSDGYVKDVTASIFTAAYVPMFASFAALLVEPKDGTARVLCFLIVVVCSDIGGYVAGVLFGKHPMAPSISPKKSWEGFSGSMLAGVIGGALSVLLLLHGHWWQGVPFGAALVVCATGGDLVESLIKRDLGIKDMGNLLPGHGGLMDRMDSLLPSAVAAWLLLTALVPV